MSNYRAVKTINAEYKKTGLRDIFPYQVSSPKGYPGIPCNLCALKRLIIFLKR